MNNNKTTIDNLICVLVNSIKQQDESQVITTSQYELGVLDGSRATMIDILYLLGVEL